MPRLAANLSLLFTEAPFMERFALAARSGFRAVEFLFPYAWPAEELAEQLRAHGLRQVLFNLPPGRWEQGERGLACLSGREDEFLCGVEQGIAYAKALGNDCVHAMAGIAPPHVSQDRLEATYTRNMAQAARLLAPHGLTLCLEAINQRSMPGYFLRTQAQAARYIEAMGEANIRLQFDFFHVQMEEGCVALKLREFFPLIAHCQLAGVPERHEPDKGELYYPYLLHLLDAVGYAGFVGCEYTPADTTAQGLAWLKPWL